MSDHIKSAAQHTDFSQKNRDPRGGGDFSAKNRASPSRVGLVGKLICRDAEDVAIVARYLPEHIRLSRAEAGCLSFDVWQDAGDPLIWHVAETFVDRAAFDAHQIRTRASDWFGQTAGIPRSYTISDGG